MASTAAVDDVVKVTARLRPSLKNEKGPAHGTGIRIEGTQLRISLPAAKEETCSFDRVHDEDASTRVVYAQTVAPLVGLLCEGYNTAVLAFGETGSGKSHTLEGPRGSQDGVIQLAIEGLFTMLADRQVKDPSLECRVRIQYYELYNELVSDLLQPQNKDLEFDEDEEVGIVVRGVTSREIRDVGEGVNVVAEGKLARTSVVTDIGPASARATAVCVVELSRAVGDGDPLRSRMMFVDMPGGEKLAEDPTSVRMREGASMNRSILAFGQLVEDLAGAAGNGRGGKGNTPFGLVSMRGLNASMSVGANASVRGLGGGAGGGGGGGGKSGEGGAVYEGSKLTMLLQDVIGGNAVTRVILTLKPTVDPGRTSATVAIARQLSRIRNSPLVNTRAVCSVLRRYRQRIAGLREQVSVLRDTRGAESDGRGATAGEGRTLRDNLDKVRLQEENERVQLRLSELRSKFNEVVASKTELSAALIASEEERLRVSKALVDLQIENNRVAEDGESKNFELVNKVLGLENDVLELEMRCERQERSAEEMRVRLESAEADRRELADEYAVLKGSHVALTKAHHSEVHKGEELGLELLNLVNAKAALLRERDALAAQLDALRTRNDSLLHKVSDGETTHTRREVELGDLRTTVDKVRADMMAKQVELGHRNVQLESQRVDLERQVIEMQRMRDKDVVALRRQHEEELRKSEDIRTAAQKEVNELKVALRRVERRAQDLAADAESAREAKGALERENAALQQHHRELVEEYRARLQRYVRDVSDHLGSMRANGVATVHLQVREAVESMIAEVRQSFAEREREAVEKASQQTERTRALETRVQRIALAYRQLRHRFEDFAGADAEKLALPSEAEVMAGVDVAQGAGGVRGGGVFGGGGGGGADGASMRAALAAAEHDLAEMRRKVADDSRRHRRTLADVEARYSAIVDELRGELEGRVRRMSSEDKARTILQMQKTITELRVAAMTAVSPQAAEELARLREDNDRLVKDARETARGGKFEALKQRLHDFTAQTQHDLEKERSALMVRCTLAEEQLSRMQEHLDKLTAAHRKEISRYKKALAAHAAASGGAGGSSQAAAAGEGDAHARASSHAQSTHQSHAQHDAGAHGHRRSRGERG